MLHGTRGAVCQREPNLDQFSLWQATLSYYRVWIRTWFLTFVPKKKLQAHHRWIHSKNSQATTLQICNFCIFWTGITGWKRFTYVSVLGNKLGNECALSTDIVKQNQTCLKWVVQQHPLLAIVCARTYSTHACIFFQSGCVKTRPR